MQKTTVYLPDDLKSALERASKALQRSEADLIREGVQLVAQSYMAPEPRLPLFESDDPSLARHVDDALAGFGER